MSLAIPPRDPAVTPKRLLLLSIPALAVGILSALVLWTVDSVAGVLDGLLWTTCPTRSASTRRAGGSCSCSPLTGLAVGLALQFVPGHGGPDSATTELIAARR